MPLLQSTVPQSGSVTSGALGTPSVFSGQIGSGQIAHFHFGSGAIQSGDIASGQVGQGHLGSGALVSGQLATTSTAAPVASGNVASGSLGNVHVASGGFLSGAYGSGSVGTVHVSSGGLGSGALGSGQGGQALLASGAVQSGQLATAATTAPISSGNIASGSIGQVHLASGVGVLGPGAVLSGYLNSGIVFSGNLASGQVCNFHLSSGAALSGNLGNACVNSGNVSSGQLGTFHVGSGGLGSGAHSSGSIGTVHVASGGFQSGSIGSGTLAHPVFGSGAILSGDVASGQLGQFHFSSGSVLSGAFASGGIASGQINSGQVSTFALSSGAVNSGQVGNAAVNSGNLSSGQLDWAHFASGATVTRSLTTAAFVSGVLLAPGVGSGMITEEIISGVCAVAISQSGNVRVAMADVSGRMPAVGVVVDNVLSGLAVNVYVAGAFQLPVPSGSMNYSGYVGQPVYVGRSGQIVTASGALNSAGFVANTSIIQPLGVAYNSGAVLVDVGPQFLSGVSVNAGSGSVQRFQLGSGAVNSGHVASGAVQGSLWGGTLHIVSGSVGPLDLGSGSVLSGHVASGQLGQFHFGSGKALSGTFPSGGVTSGQINSGQVGFPHLANAGVQSGHVASGQIIYFHFGSGAVASGHVQSGAVLGANSSGAHCVASGTVGSFDLGNAVVLSGHVGSGQLAHPMFGSGAVLSGDIASGQIGVNHLASGVQPNFFNALMIDGLLDPAGGGGGATSGETFSVCFVSGTTLGLAMAGSGLRLPPVGILLNVSGGRNSGLIQQVFLGGNLQVGSGMDAYWSGMAGKPLYVGSGGVVVTQSGLLSGMAWFQLGTATSGGILVSDPDSVTVQSGNINSGQIGNPHLSSGAVGFGQVGSGAITSGTFGQSVINSGNVASGAVPSTSMQSGANVVNADVVHYDLWGNTVPPSNSSGSVGAVAIVSGTWVSGGLNNTVSGLTTVARALPGSGLRMPAVGIYNPVSGIAGTISGFKQTVTLQGQIAMASGFDAYWSGLYGVPLYVGADSTVVPSGHALLSGISWQQVGVGYSGGMIVNPQQFQTTAQQIASGQIFGYSFASGSLSYAWGYMMENLSNAFPVAVCASSGVTSSGLLAVRPSYYLSGQKSPTIGIYNPPAGSGSTVSGAVVQYFFAGTISVQSGAGGGVNLASDATLGGIGSPVWVDNLAHLTASPPTASGLPTQRLGTSTTSGGMQVVLGPFHTVQSGGYLSGEIGSGQIGRNHLASGTVVDYFPCEQAMSGIVAVAWGSGGCFIVPAERHSGLRMPCIGVAVGNYASGAIVTVVTKGLVGAPNSGTVASGVYGLVYVGSGGLITNLSGFAGGASSGYGVVPPGSGIFSGMLVQRLGTMVSGGIFVNIDPQPTSGLYSGVQGIF